VKRISKKDLPVQDTERRAGDPAELVSDPSRLKEVFDWHPKLDDIDKIVRTAYDWEHHRTY
jgi:UDP-glucose 4-epimerase